jgi:hypothetical protein
MTQKIPLVGMVGDEIFCLVFGRFVVDPLRTGTGFVLLILSLFYLDFIRPGFAWSYRLFATPVVTS